MDTRRTFHAQLDEIMRDTVLLAAHVTEGLPRATEALLTGDLDAAQAIIDHDVVLDALAIDIEERCYASLALQQPMASDLRAIIAAIRLVAEIERSGDLVVNICKAQHRVSLVVLPATVRGLLSKMDELTVALFRRCMDAYVDGDAELAATLEAMDDRLDQAHADYIQAVLTWGAGEGSIQPAVQLALVGRYYERIGDHAVNIGERVRYMVDGWMPEPTPELGAAHGS